MKRTELATAAIHIAHSIEAHLTGAVATISQRNQGVSEGVGISVFDFSFLSFKAKAFRFCHFFCPQNVIPTGFSNVMPRALGISRRKADADIRQHDAGITSLVN